LGWNEVPEVELILAIIGGGAGAALVAGVFGLLQWRLNRKAQKEDRAADRRQADCSARGKEIEELRRLVKVLCLADRTLLYDRIKYLAKAHIEKGHITVEDLEDLNMMHSVYHDKDKLDGNGFLDNLMHTVNHTLEIRAK
jgi:hypothetical protein